MKEIMNSNLQQFFGRLLNNRCLVEFWVSSYRFDVDLQPFVCIVPQNLKTNSSIDHSTAKNEILFFKSFVNKIQTWSKKIDGAPVCDDISRAA